MKKQAMKIIDIIETYEDQIILNTVLSLAKKEKINSICDYGCGDGRILRSIKKQVSEGKTLTGIDIWSNPESEKEKPLDEGINYIDGLSDGFDDFVEKKLFDLVLSTFTLHHFRLPVKEISRMCSLLKPGGYLVMIDMFRDYTDMNKVADNVFFYTSQMMMMAIKGKFHRAPYTLPETSDLLSNQNLEIISQDIVKIGLTSTEVEQFENEIVEMRSSRLKQIREEDEEKGAHSAILDSYEHISYMTESLFDKYGTSPDDLLVTIAQKY